ncbi:hypothetical protein D0865_02966 [Hortaea werneckii]|uniref:V-type proton ATPase subunit e n=1 Tax=Hortaea werneckii TaxID=91943 RepID=A0A3M7D0I1_HORWE|nr:hypothetical protein D0865_02966 [Hortaea werneckii]
MANGWSLIISIIFIAVFSVAAWFLSPKSDTQTVWRSTLILSAWSCWLMWGTYLPLQDRNQGNRERTSSGVMGRCRRRNLFPDEGLAMGIGTSQLTRNTAITFLAQWHPLIVPERGDLRPEYNNGPIKSGRMF